MCNNALTRELLEWIGYPARNYVETMEAWRTSCPRLSIWEDAVSAGLIERVPGLTMRDATVCITEAGQSYLQQNGARIAGIDGGAGSLARAEDHCGLRSDDRSRVWG
jgi:hypothetical protein